MTRRSAIRWLVFTDLDGTLLDHDEYSYDAALPALEAFKARGVPVIINSSKTVPEIEKLRRELDNRDPFIAENGAVTCVPGGTFDGTPGAHKKSAQEHFFSADHAHIASALGSLRDAGGYRFRGFSDMPDSEIATRTGLGIDDARLAATRLASEPIVWEDTPERLEIFRAALAERGLRTLQGGRFLHVMGETDKGAATRRLRDEYARHDPDSSWRTIAFGDSPNDAAMLDAADVAVIVRSDRSGELAPSSPGRVIRTRERGSAGWSEAARELLEDIPLAGE